jgi:nicotinate-nucleotide--dimethylbenzimidazole phosphoribosyltransferase
VAENISAFPQSVTREMIQNFAAGGAAINVLACALDAHLEIIDLGTADQVETKIKPQPEIRRHSLGPGTHNFLRKAAMDNNQLAAAMAVGKASVEHAQKAGNQLFIGGEMGIGNTTSAAALACALLKIQPSQMVGPGSGLSDQGVMHKADVIEHALALHRAHIFIPREALRRLGGFEIAALVGAYVRCAQLGFPVLIDGFISTVAALAAESICPQSKNWFIYAHQSAEPGHVHVLKALGAHPLFDLGMRLGEGSGAAVAVNLLRMACALHNQMATFSGARVSSKKQSYE